ncbi:triphosphoribosyl-dephospho-CoA synthase [Pyrofollis japonicus]|uniref:triphosphoribosyl-dephospho-CoA synthase n=1 Tax=Pyrofollis japonicus TaxID=3060460 RepID=UPI00295A9AE4|nr:triphosphoribosyl-dephospho-CoA synthase [Pyrofollis japonicus]
MGEAMRPRSICRAYAHACSISVIIDAAVPRPGLSSFSKPRPDLDPVGFAAYSPIAYEMCLCSCEEGAKLAHLFSRSGTWCRCWNKAIRHMKRWGNVGLGSSLLLALQGAALGYAFEKYAKISIDHVAGSTVYVLSLCGRAGTKYFYDSLRLLTPSYLGRLSWSGLPDASQPLIDVGGLPPFQELIKLASLYDPVSFDAHTMFSLSFGLALPILGETPCLTIATKRATYLLASMLDDFLLKRKLGRTLRSLWERAAEGDRSAEAELENILRHEGPGSVADIVINALARRIFDALILNEPLYLSC